CRKIVPLALGKLQLMRELAGFGVQLAPAIPQMRHSPRVRQEAAELVEEITVGGRIEQGAIVVLPMDLDEQPAELTQQAGGHWPIVEEGFGPAIGELDTSQHQRLALVEAMLAKQASGWMARRQVERCGNACRLSALAHKAAIAARSQRKAEAIEYNRLARPGLARENRQPLGEAQVELVDQNNIADRKSGKHSALLSDSPF